jgi:regulator of sirC expression with transglutaminase-like and TPR domain
MTAAPEEVPFHNQATAETFLRRLGEMDGTLFPLAAAALALALLARPEVDPRPYHDHLARLALEVGVRAAGAEGMADRLEALTRVLFRDYAYAGDTRTYDDLVNADLMRVIDRRKGLPVALGILFIHAARAQGWTIAGLAFPGHFLVRLETAGQRAVIDPFNGGAIRDAAMLRALLQSTQGAEARLLPAHHEAVGDRAILLRLQNNLILRQLRGGDPEAALDSMRGLLLLAPDEPTLLRDCGLINVGLGNLRAAAGAFERLLAVARDPRQLDMAGRILQQLSRRLD